MTISGTLCEDSYSTLTMPAPKPKSTRRKRAPKKAAAGSRGILPQDCRLDAGSGDTAEVSRRIESEGGVVLGT